MDVPVKQRSRSPFNWLQPHLSGNKVKGANTASMRRLNTCKHYCKMQKNKPPDIEIKNFYSSTLK